APRCGRPRGVRARPHGGDPASGGHVQDRHRRTRAERAEGAVMSAVVLSITTGRGPAECRTAVAKILAEIAREAGQAGLAIDIVPGDEPDGAGPISARVSIRGDGAAAFGRSWLGTIQWIAPRTVRGARGRKNFFVGVRLAEAVNQNFVLSPAEVR